MKGTFTAIVTPFKNGMIDYQSFERLINFQIENGVDGIVPAGTTGESPTLSHQEHKELITFTVKTVAKRCKIIAGTGANSTAETLELTAHAEKTGADAALLVCPYYNKPTQEGLLQHYTAVADSCSIPLVLYDVPGRCGIEIKAQTIAKLAKHKNIKAVKDATGSLDKTSEILFLTQGSGFSVISGNDSVTVPLISVGGSGIISVVSNILPKETKTLTDAALAGNFEKARELHLKLWPLFTGMFVQTNPIPVKAACYLAGLIDTPEYRLPLCAMESGLIKVLQETMRSAGITIKNPV